MKKIIALTLALIISLSFFSLVSFAEETDTVEHLTEVPVGYIGIYTKDDLDNIKLDMAGKYILMNDIVFGDSDYVKGGSFYNSGKGWEPIGTTSTNFKGTLDGNGYRIKNLYINNPNRSYVGLFGYIVEATIKNIILENANLIGKNYVGGVAGYVSCSTVTNVALKNTSIMGNDYVGGVIGYSYRTTTVSYCNVLGSVSGTNNVGGIVGYQTTSKTVIENTTYNYIVYCHNGAKVSAKSKAGGIVGYSTSCVKRLYKSSPNTTSGAYYYYYEYSYVKNCSNSGDIIASDSIAGGIVGQTDLFKYSDEYADSYVEYCYNCGHISAPSYTGGLVGRCYAEANNFKHCYSVGAITGSSNFGGCFGDIPKTATFCYYLDEAVENPTCTVGISKSEDQLKKQTAYEQWNFASVWTMKGREDYPYPELIDVPLILPSDSEHKHEYISEITTPATHIATGVMTYTCECGDTYTEDIEKIAEHSYEAVITAPTCIAKGYTTYVCECNNSYVADYVDAKGHDFKSTVSESDCTKFGYTTFVCECGETYTCDYTNVKGHTYTSEITTPATHTTEGVKTFTCECGDTYTETVEKIADHSYEAVVTAPTCTAYGYTTLACECGENYTSNYTSATNHIDNDGDYKCDYGCGYAFEKPADPTPDEPETPDTPSEPTDDCSCNCHKGGIVGFFFKIILFFQKLFGMNKVCTCGVKH